MKSYSTLPAGHRQIYTVNLQKDKRTAAFINISALGIAAVMIIPMHFFVPISTSFDWSGVLLPYALRFFVLFVSTLLYMVLHELIHGAAMKVLGTKKIRYGFTGPYAFAGSTDFYDKTGYCFVALAPIVVFLIVFAVLNCVVPRTWFWVVYLLQVANISGAAGDLFVTVKFSKMPKDILIQDSGVDMTVYSKSQI